MPFTPFHFGPAALVKALFRYRFSFGLFCLVQIFIDGETLYHILRNEHPVHGTLHTFLGSNIAVAAGLLFRPLYVKALNLLIAFDKGMKTKFTLSISSALFTLVLAAYSHVFFDSLMHGDIRPFYPFSDANPFLGIISVDLLHAVCLLSAGAGVIILGLRYAPRKRKRRGDPS
mgnify:CR=1 FL=1